MKTDLEYSSLVMLADRLEPLRESLLDPSNGSTDHLSALKSGLDALVAEGETTGLADLAEVLRRLSIMIEVCECLLAEGPGPGGEAVSFCDKAIGLLCEHLRNGEVDRVASEILDDSAARWGQYLALVDPDWPSEPGIELEDIASDVPDREEPASTMTPAALLGMLTGSPVPAESSGRPDAMVEAPGPMQPRSSPSKRESGQPGASVPHEHDNERSLSAPPGDFVAEAQALELDEELREVFLADAEELFARVQDLVLGQGAGDEDEAGRLRDLKRCYHTLKGSAGSVGLVSLAGSIHGLEDRIEQAEGRISDDLQQRLEQSLSMIEASLSALRGDATDHTPQPEPSAAPAPTPAPMVPQEPMSDSPMSGSGDALGMIRLPPARFEELLDLGSELLARRHVWLDQAEAMKQFAGAARSCSQRLRAEIDRLIETLPRAKPGDGSEVAEERRNEVLRRLSEQAEDLAVLAASARSAAVPMADEGEVLDRLGVQLWDALQSVRVVPARGLFQRLVRVGREAARVEGRAVEFSMIGEETGLDRTLLDRAFEPLMHVVRNAVGHGIESAEDRTRAGKPSAGRIVLEAKRAGNTVVLSVEDDGRGLDDEAIAAKARRLGLIGPDEQPGADRLHALIFHPGFSTRSEANAISGRGVGMDVVAREVGALRGRIELSSRPGQGTRLTIRLPTRLSLEQAMLVRILGQPFAVPIPSIVSIQPDEGDSGRTVEVAGRRLDRIDPRSLLGLSDTTPAPCPRLLVVEAEVGAVAMRVDAIDGPRELIVRPLSPLLAGHPAISGACQMTTGEVVFVLDLAGLIRLARGGGPGVVPVAPIPERQRPRALVVDDSISVRRATSRQLRALGFEVVEAADGQEALGMLREASQQQPYQLVWTDLEMPRMDGFELLMELRRTGALESIPVIVSSSRTDPDTRRRVRELGARSFVPKPAEPEEIIQAVSPLLADRA